MKHIITIEVETDKESLFESVRQFANALGKDLGTSVRFEIDVQEPDNPTLPPNPLEYN